MKERDHPLYPLVSGWMTKIKRAMKFKDANFADDAREAMQFFNGPYNFMWSKEYMQGKRGFYVGDDEESLPAPSFQMCMNKVAEMVQIMGPSFYHHNPNIMVSTKEPSLPPPEMLLPPPPPAGMPADPMQQQQAMLAQMQMQMMQQQERIRNAVNQARAGLLEFVLNYYQQELDKKQHARRAIVEAIIKGLGLLWTESYEPYPGAPQMIGSFYDTVDNLCLDADAEVLEDCQWIARKCVLPVWEIERQYGLPAGYLKEKGTLESLRSQGETTQNKDAAAERQKGKTNDLLPHWKIWSKMGMGERMTGMAPELSGQFDDFGDYCYLCVCDTVGHPLNIHPDVWDAAVAGDEQAAESMFQSCQWPIPFWADGEWPFTPFAFHWVPGSVWPMSHVKPGMGELKFLNWAMSFLATKIRTTCRDFICVVKAAGDEMVDKILNGRDFTVLTIDDVLGKTISEVVSFLQHPTFQQDIYRVIAEVAEVFDKRTGLSEILYGMQTTQSRSAADVQIRQQNASGRIDDMANAVEDALSRAARKEAMACRWLQSEKDLLPVLGPAATQTWMQVVASADLTQVARELAYRVEAGSARKPNKQTKVAQMNEAAQSLGPVLMAAMAQGDVNPINSFIREWCLANEIAWEGFMLSPPMPMPSPEDESAPDEKPPMAEKPQNGKPKNRMPAV